MELDTSNQPMEYFGSEQLNALNPQIPSGGEDSGLRVGGGSAGAILPTSIDLTNVQDLIAVGRAIRAGWPISQEQIDAIVSQIGHAFEVAKTRDSRYMIQLGRLLVLMERENQIARGVIPPMEVNRTRPERKRRPRGFRRQNKPSYRELAEARYQQALAETLNRSTNNHSEVTASTERTDHARP